MVIFNVTELNQRLDQIVIAHYGDLQHFDRVKRENQHLIDVHLKMGDTVNLPFIETDTGTTEDVLW